MKDLKNVTFMIPVRIDSQDRADNLDLVTEYILNSYDTTIMIHEYSESRKYYPKNNKVSYEHILDTNKYFHRTAILNNMIEASITDVVVNYDADVLLFSNAYKACYDVIAKGMHEVVYPYNGKFLALDRKYHWQIKEKGYKVDTLPLDSITTVVHPGSVGGAFMALKSNYIKCGMENKNFKAWGFEDNERFDRFTKLTGVIPRATTPLVHLEHWRGPDSSFANPYIEGSRMEMQKVIGMSKAELENYIKTW